MYLPTYTMYSSLMFIFLLKYLKFSAMSIQWLRFILLHLNGVCRFSTAKLINYTPIGLKQLLPQVQPPIAKNLSQPPFISNIIALFKNNYFKLLKNFQWKAAFYILLLLLQTFSDY